jgi:hypothetical protein
MKSTHAHRSQGPRMEQHRVSGVFEWEGGRSFKKDLSRIVSNTFRVRRCCRSMLIQ